MITSFTDLKSDGVKRVLEMRTETPGQIQLMIREYENGPDQDPMIILISLKADEFAVAAVAHDKISNRANPKTEFLNRFEYPADYGVINNRSGPADFSLDLDACQGKIETKRAMKATLDYKPSNEIQFYLLGDHVSIVSTNAKHPDTVVTTDVDIPQESFLALAWSFIKALPKPKNSL